MEAFTRSVAEFSPQERSVFERVLGKSFKGSETLRIEVVDPQVDVRPPRPRPPVAGVPTGGEYAGRLIVPDDFDEPLEELSEYLT